MTALPLLNYADRQRRLLAVSTYLGTLARGLSPEDALGVAYAVGIIWRHYAESNDFAEAAEYYLPAMQREDGLPHREVVAAWAFAVADAFVREGRP